MEGKPDHRDARDGGSLAPRRPQALLAMDFPRAEVRWQETNLQRGTRSDFSDGRGESDLGCASNSRGVAKVLEKIGRGEWI